MSKQKNEGEWYLVCNRALMDDGEPLGGHIIPLGISGGMEKEEEATKKAEGVFAEFCKEASFARSPKVIFVRAINNPNEDATNQRSAEAVSAISEAGGFNC